MSVCVVILDETEAISLIRWGYYFAHARHLDLVVGYPKRAEDDANSPVGNTIRDTLAQLDALYPEHPAEKEPQEEAIPHECDTRLHVLAARPQASEVNEIVRSEKCQLLILGKREGDSPRALANDLFVHAPCDTLLLRPGDEEGLKAGRILVPCAGGPHATVALQWAHDLCLRYDGELTPLFVENAFGPLAEEVGKHRLDNILRSAGIKATSWVKSQVVVADDVQQGITAAAHSGCDLLLVGASDHGYVRRILFSTLPQRLLSGPHGMAVGALRRAKPLGTRIRDAIERWLDVRIPQLDRSQRIELVERLEDGADWSFDFMAMMCLSTAIAAFGLILNSTAVVIGAMLVAPLMTPLLAAGFGLVQGNGVLVRQSARSVAYGFMLALGIGFVCALFTPTAHLTGEMLGRGSPNLYDLMVAAISGVAAAYALSRPNLSAALPGVAIAAALVPPLATSGISLGYGEIANARGAALLFATNVVAIVLAAAAVFYVRGVRGNRSYGAPRLWAKRLLFALLLAAGILLVPLSSVLVGQLRAGRYALPAERLQDITRTAAEMDAVLVRGRGRRNTIDIWLQSPRMLSQQEMARLRACVGQDRRPLRVHTDLVVEVPASDTSD